MSSETLVTGTVIINAPILDVFDYIVEPSHVPEFIPFYSRVEKDFDGVPTRGSTFRAAVSFGGPGMPDVFGPMMQAFMPFMPQTIAFCVDDIVPGRRIAYRANEFAWTTICDFEPAAGRTIFTMTHSLWSATGLASAFWMTPMQMMGETILRRILEGLKRRLEGRAIAARPRIFFSYRRDESRYVGGRIYDALISEFGAGTVFRDTDSLVAGRDWDLDIKTAIEGASVVVVHVGDGWEEQLLENDGGDDGLRDELETALQRDQRRPMIPVITSDHDGVSLYDRMNKIQHALTKMKNAPFLAARFNTQLQAQALRADPDFGADLERLMRSVWYAFRHPDARAA